MIATQSNFPKVKHFLNVAIFYDTFGDMLVDGQIHLTQTRCLTLVILSQFLGRVLVLSIMHCINNLTITNVTSDVASKIGKQAV